MLSKKKQSVNFFMDLPMIAMVDENMTIEEEPKIFNKAWNQLNKESHKNSVRQ